MNCWTINKMSETSINKRKDNWFRKNRKAIAVHSSILAAFILLLIFASGTAFDNLISVLKGILLNLISR